MRGFVEPFCKLKGIGTTGRISVRIKMPCFGVNSAQTHLTLVSLVQKAGWNRVANSPALSDPVANLIGTFSAGRNKVWLSSKPGSSESYSRTAMTGASNLFKDMPLSAPFLPAVHVDQSTGSWLPILAATKPTLPWLDLTWIMSGFNRTGDLTENHCLPATPSPMILERFNLKNSHIPVTDRTEIPPRCQKLERILVRGATALGPTSVFFDYD